MYLSFTQVVHIFSHINQTYVIFAVPTAKEDEAQISSSRPTRWVTKKQFLDSAVSTAMKKVTTHIFLFVVCLLVSLLQRYADKFLVFIDGVRALLS